MRARSIEEFVAAFDRVFVPDEVLRSIVEFRPEPSDVIIAPFAKCGTTWLQQIFHTLRTRGDEAFDDISRVVPWIETAAALGLDLAAPQRARPRGFKSHLGWDLVPKGARYIVALRDPAAVAVSFYRFMEGWFIEPGAIALDAFVRAVFLPSAANAGRDYWHHLVSWWSVRDDPAVLLLCYEDMLRDPAGTVRRVARHVGLPLDAELLARTLERSGRDYMLRHASRFDDALMRALSERRCGFPPGSESAKVRPARPGAPEAELGATVRDELRAVWRERVPGFPDYAALRAALAAESARA